MFDGVVELHFVGEEQVMMRDLRRCCTVCLLRLNHGCVLKRGGDGGLREVGRSGVVKLLGVEALLDCLPVWSPLYLPAMSAALPVARPSALPVQHLVEVNGCLWISLNLVKDAAS